MQGLTKERKQPLVIILQQVIFHNIFILRIWLGIITRSNQGVWFMNFPSQIFFNDINHGYRAAILKKSSLWLLAYYLAVANMKMCTKRCALQLYCTSLYTTVQAKNMYKFINKDNKSVWWIFS